MICLAISVCINWDGMVLNWTKQYLERLPVLIRKPLFECLICMSSLWSIGYFIFKGYPIIQLPETIFIVCGINTIISIFVEKFTDYGL
jgi:hypothetical protein